MNGQSGISPSHNLSVLDLNKAFSAFLGVESTSQRDIFNYNIPDLRLKQANCPTVRSPAMIDVAQDIEARYLAFKTRDMIWLMSQR